MVVVNAEGIEDAWIEGCHQFMRFAQPAESRNGDMLRVRGSFTTVYSDPTKRVLFDPYRNCNPFFHLMEAIWMLAGRNDVAFVERYNARMREYSDDGESFNGAYGYRWRIWFHHDQIKEVIWKLYENKWDRRALIQMYDSGRDHLSFSKDIPCNLIASFHVWDGQLDMTVFNRSNDLVWGAYGSNVVHFSMLQEVIASAIGCKVGEYSQISANTHVYLPHVALVKETAAKATMPPSRNSGLNSKTATEQLPLIENGDHHSFLTDCEVFCSDSSPKVFTKFFHRIVKPMNHAWDLYKAGQLQSARDSLANGWRQYDWIEAGVQWLDRVIQKRAAK